VKNLFIIGGNRLNEIYPFQTIIDLNKRFKYKLFIYTENLHLKKKISKKNNFRYFLNKKNINYTKVINYKDLVVKVKNDIDKSKNKSYCLLLNSLFIIKKDLIKLFDSKIFNVHTGLLPNQRGAAVQTWQIMSRLKESAVTIHKVTTEIDKGNIIFEKKINCKNILNEKDFNIKASKSEKYLLSNLFDMIKQNNIVIGKRQKTAYSIYMPRLNTPTHSFINWNWEGKDIVSFINAFSDPFQGARTFVGKKLFIIKKAKIYKEKQSFHPFQFGIIYRIDKNYIYVAAKGCCVKIDGTSLKNFNKLIGKRFYTPIKFLESALQSRAIHFPNNIKIK
jgi:methionyl-tRNA formyltransferase